MEASQEGRDALLRAELRGYLDGQVLSINNNLNTAHSDLTRQIDELQSQIGELRSTLHGHHGDDGLRSEVRQQRWIVRIQWALIVVLIVHQLGIPIPFVP